MSLKDDYRWLSLARMIDGEIPTAREFPCPACAGTAIISAVSAGDDHVAIAISCNTRRCVLIHIDGVKHWLGWETLKPTDSDVPRYSAEEITAMNRRVRARRRRR